MREILFRGKRRDNGAWYFGSYLFLHVPDLNWTGQAWGPSHDVHFIVNQEDYKFAVDPETIGQYTGKKDRNGQRIFEGDLLEYTDDEGGKSMYVVKWDESGWAVQCWGCLTDNMQDWDAACWEIKGNIFDNPDMAKEAAGK